MARPSSPQARKTSDLLRLVDATSDQERGRSGWGTENPGYNPRDFYVGSTDGRGHSNNVQVSMPPEIASAMTHMVAEKDIPAYRSIQDLIRDAVVHRIHQLHELGMTHDEELQRIKRVLVNRSRIETFNREQESMRGVIEDSEKMLREATVNGDTFALRQALTTCEEMAEEMREPWRGRLEEVIERYQRAI